jgi:hypothetical protein
VAGGRPNRREGTQNVMLAAGAAAATTLWVEAAQRGRRSLMQDHGEFHSGREEQTEKGGRDADTLRGERRETDREISKRESL